MQNVFEVNFDTLVGPTHNYSGLALDDLASRENEGSMSNPREAALQGLKKMKFLADHGIKQVVLPPHERPLIHALEQLGFSGPKETILKTARELAPRLLSACSSASYMWTANAATVTPSLDSLDHKLHITPANLVSEFHRTIESIHTAHILKTIFNNAAFFTVHPPLKASASLGDEGAANHTRLCPSHSSQGLHLFVYGRSGFPNSLPRPKQFHPRQTLEASQTIARFHKIPSSNVIFAQQHPDAIDAGVFHNDVICVGNENVLFYHEKAFLDTRAVIKNLKNTYEALYNQELHCIEVPQSKVTLHEAVKTYLFNSQLITTPKNKRILLVPTDCYASSSVKAFLETLLTHDSQINAIQSIDVSQSMRNGGGPACLRLRVVLTEEELQALPQSIFLNDELYKTLVAWVKNYYRKELYPSDLGSLDLLNESHQALVALNDILRLNK